MKKILVVLGLMLIGVQHLSYAQKTRKQKAIEKAAEVNKLVESKQYRFVANFVQPLRGGNFNLTSSYDVVVKKDSLLSYLPYFGVAFSATPYNSTNSPLIFNSTKFNYQQRKGKKGSWEIEIEFKENGIEVSKYFISISVSGYSSLRTLSINRDPITFNGYITPID